MYSIRRRQRASENEPKGNEMLKVNIIDTETMVNVVLDELAETWEEAIGIIEDYYAFVQRETDANPEIFEVIITAA